MPEDKKDPTDQAHSSVDIEKILLPKKEGPSIDSAQRINAGVLLEQEQNATLPKPEPQPVVPPPAPAKDESLVKPLQTYRGDVESLVQEKNISTVSIAAAEQDRPRPAAPQPQVQGTSLWVRAAYWGGGVLLVSIAVALGAYVLTRPTTVPVVPLDTAAPFIRVDDTTQIPAAGTRDGLMNALNNAREGSTLSLGLVERLFVALPAAEGDTTLREVPAQQLVRTLVPFAPEPLVRTLGDTYLLGVHSFDSSQAFLILTPDSYEVAYAGMLEWEYTMHADLMPLFERVPPVRSVDIATSSPTSTAAVIPTEFVDRVVENIDARVIQNEYRDILLLWAFLDRSTLVITTNEFTLREILSRRTSVPNLGLPAAPAF